MDINDNAPEFATEYEAFLCENGKPGQVRKEVAHSSKQPSITFFLSLPFLLSSCIMIGHSELQPIYFTGKLQRWEYGPFSLQQSSLDTVHMEQRGNESSHDWSEWIIIQDCLSCPPPDGIILPPAKHPVQVLSILLLINRPHSGDLCAYNREPYWKGEKKRTLKKGKLSHRARILNSNQS